MTTLNWADATAAVQASTNILIVSHVQPDGDAFGSALGLANALIERGHRVTVAIDGGKLDFVEFLPGIEMVKSKLKSGKWDLMISVDSSDEERTGMVGAYGRTHSQKVINLDHHATNTFFGDIFLVQPDAVSATQVIYEWLGYMQQPISKAVAVPLLTGLVTDTLGFRTSNVRPETLEIAMRLMEAGASLTEVTARTLDNKPFSTIQLWKNALATVEMHGQVIAAIVTQSNLQAANLSEMTDGGLVGLLNSVTEAMIAVVFKELHDGRVELSLRCKPGYNVAEVAFGLGGGGHKQAAGATIAGPLEAAQARVLPLLQAAASMGALSIV